MYEDMTFDAILTRCLDRVPNTLDKREGSIIYDAIAPAAAELAIMYIQLDTILNETFADTATRYYLVKRAAERGVNPTPATHAVLKGVFDIDIPVGSRFSLGDLNYKATEKISTGVYKMTCETAGEEGNLYTGRLIPIDYIAGLGSAELTEILIPGENEEDTESLRTRYFDSLSSLAYGGNIKDYKDKIGLIDGVGGVKVYPTPNNVGGTVRVVIISSAYTKPSSTLIQTVQDTVDPVSSQGKGVGIAPIGHVVTIAGVDNTIVNISTTITYESGWNWEAVKSYAEEAVDNYFLELAQEWAGENNLIVRISQIETRLLNLPGVLDITGTMLNGSTQNLSLDADNIPVRGTLNG